MSPAVSRYATLWLLVAQVLVALPVVEVLPVYILPLLLLTLGWRALIWFGRGVWPSPWLRRLLVVLVLATIVATSGFRLTLELAVTILVSGYALKMLEMRTRRDALVVAYIGFFVVAAGVIYSQSLLQAGYQLLCIVVLVAAIHALYTPGVTSGSEIKGSVRFSGGILLQALPLTLALFIFVPRLGPLWAVPWPEDEAKTGLSDTLRPGDVARLSQSYELAFRAQFNGPLPPVQARYWRVMVLDQFDGNQWQQSDERFPTASTAPVRDGWWRTEPSVYNYEILLEPNGRQWLPVLGPAAAAVTDSTVLRTLRLEANKPVFERRLYRPLQQRVVAASVTMPLWLLALNKALPATGNPRARQLAQRLFAQAGGDPMVMAKSLLTYFNQQPFFYTLTPPLMPKNTVDEFLFTHRRGFCEHYASSFVFMMRAAGIPARIVTGYLGGDAQEQVIRVLQRDAHAWAEIWVAGQGWVRFDPTAAVAPERIDLGINEMIARGDLRSGQLPLAYRLSQAGLLKSFRENWEQLEYRWQKLVVQYQQDQQSALMRQWFGTSAFYWQQIGALGALLVVFLSLVTILALLRKSPLSDQQKIWLRLERKLAKKGVKRQPAEGPKDFGLRVAKENSDLGKKVSAVVEVYLQAVYSLRCDQALLDRLKRMVREL